MKMFLIKATLNTYLESNQQAVKLQCSSDAKTVNISDQSQKANKKRWHIGPIFKKN